MGVDAVLIIISGTVSTAVGFVLVAVLSIRARRQRRDPHGLDNREGLRAVPLHRYGQGNDPAVATGAATWTPVCPTA